MSSTAHILVGQCGNQLGASFLNALCSEAGGGSEALEEEEGETNVHRDSFTRQTTSMMTSAAYHHRVSKAHFRRPLPSRWRSGSGSATEFSPSLSSFQTEHYLPEPRCILVDMEPQVVGGLLRRGETTKGAYGSRWGEEGETCSRMDQDVDRVGSSAFSSSSSSSRTNARYDAERGGEGEGKSGNEAYFGSSSLVSPLFHYSPQQCVTRAEGSGNNWACGYLYQGESRRQAIEDCLARELEAKDTIVHTFHVVHSLAGGTGSGVGSLVGEVVKDMQPHSCSLLHSVVWPFSSGEVVTQWYNVCCTLASLKENADGVHILFNDGMLDQITQYADSVGSRITRYSGDPSIPSTSSTPFLPRLSRDHGVSQIDFSILNAAFAHSMLPLHVPQYLCAVPSPKYDLRKQRIPGIQRGGGRGDSSGDGGDVVSSFSHPSHRSTLESDQRRRAFGSSEGEGRTGTTPLRYARTEDVLEAVGALDPGMKFFTASSMPFSFSPSSVAGSPSFGAFPWRAQNDTSWQGVLTEAGRVAQHMYGGGEPPTTCASSCSSARDSFLFSSYAPRSCLWCLSGPDALTDGIHTLQDVLAQFRAVHRSYSPSSTVAAEEEGKWKITPHDKERGVKGESFSSAASTATAGGTSFPYPSEVLPFPLSSLFVHPRPSFVHSLSAEAKDPTSTPTASTVITRYPRHQVHLYGPSPRIGIQAEYAAYRAEKLLQVNAFVHHYTKYGLEKCFLKDAVATAYEIAAIYKAAY